MHSIIAAPHGVVTVSLAFSSLLTQHTALTPHTSLYTLSFILCVLSTQLSSPFSTLCSDVPYFALHSPFSIPHTLLTMLLLTILLIHSVSSYLILHTLYCIPPAPLTRFSPPHHFLTPYSSPTINASFYFVFSLHIIFNSSCFSFHCHSPPSILFPHSQKFILHPTISMPHAG